MRCHGLGCRPADTGTGLPAPVPAEAAPVPTEQRLGLEDDRCSEQRREQPIEPDKDQPICGWRSTTSYWRRNTISASRVAGNRNNPMRKTGTRVAHRGICATPDEIFGAGQSSRHQGNPLLNRREHRMRFSHSYAACAQDWLNSCNRPRRRCQCGPSRHAYRNRHGCILYDAGAQRAASNIGAVRLPISPHR
jgi:hypothetical protein